MVTVVPASNFVLATEPVAAKVFDGWDVSD
jgi:hypothetical protein